MCHKMMTLCAVESGGDSITLILAEDQIELHFNSHSFYHKQTNDSEITQVYSSSSASSQFEVKNSQRTFQGWKTFRLLAADQFVLLNCFLLQSLPSMSFYPG